MALSHGAVNDEGRSQGSQGGGLAAANIVPIPATLADFGFVFRRFASMPQIRHLRVGARVCRTGR